MPPTFMTDVTTSDPKTSLPCKNLEVGHLQARSLSNTLIATTTSLLKGARLSTRELMSLCNDGRIPARLRNSENEVIDQPHFKNKAEHALANILSKIKDQATEDFLQGKGRSGSVGQIDQMTFGRDNQQQTDFSNLSSDTNMFLLQNTYNFDQRQHRPKGSFLESIYTLKKNDKSKSLSRSSSSHMLSYGRRVQIPTQFNLNIYQCGNQIGSMDAGNVVVGGGSEGARAQIQMEQVVSRNYTKTSPSVQALEPQSSTHLPTPIFPKNLNNEISTLQASRQDSGYLEGLGVVTGARVKRIQEMSILNADTLGHSTTSHLTFQNPKSSQKQPRSKFLQKTEKILHNFQGRSQNKNSGIKSLLKLKFSAPEFQAPEFKPIIMTERHQQLNQLQKTINFKQNQLKQMQQSAQGAFGKRKGDGRGSIKKPAADNSNQNQQTNSINAKKYQVEYKQKNITNYQLVITDEGPPLSRNHPVPGRFALSPHGQNDLSPKGRPTTGLDESTTLLATKREHAGQKMPVSTVPRVVFQRKLKDERIRDQDQEGRVFDPLCKDNQSKFTKTKRIGSKVLEIKGAGRQGNGSVILKNSDIAAKLEHTERSRSQQNKQSSDSATFKKGQFEQSSAATGVLSKSDLRMQNVYDRDSKDITKQSIIAKEVSIYEAPSRLNDNVVQSLNVSGRTSQAHDSNSPVFRRKKGGEAGMHLKQSIISACKILQEPAITVKRVRNKSQEILAFGQQKQVNQMRNGVFITEDNIGGGSGDDTISNIQIQHDFGVAKKRQQNQNQPQEQQAGNDSKHLNKVQTVEKQHSGEPPLRRKNHSGFAIKLVDRNASDKALTKESMLQNIVNQSYMMTIQDKRSLSLKPPPLKRLQDLTYRERFGFNDEGYAARIFKEWLHLKNPAAKTQKLRYLSEKSKRQSEQISFNRMIIEDFVERNGLKYDFKAVKLLRDFRTEKQIESFLYTSKLFLESLKKKKRLLSRKQQLREFQDYMEALEISDSSQHGSLNEPGNIDADEISAPLQTELNYKQKKYHQRNFTINEEDSKSTILHDSQMATGQQKSDMNCLKKVKSQKNVRKQPPVMQPYAHKQEQFLRFRQEQTYRYLQITEKAKSSQEQQQEQQPGANKDIFFEDQVIPVKDLNNMPLFHLQQLPAAPEDQASCIPRASSNSDDNLQMEENMQLMRDLKVHKFEDEMDYLQVFNQQQSSEAKTLRLVPVTDSADSTSNFKRKFRNFDLIQGIDQKQIASHDSEESNFHMQTRIYTAPRYGNRPSISVQGQKLKTVDRVQENDMYRQSARNLGPSNLAVQSTPRTIERPHSPGLQLPPNQQLHHFRVKIPSQMEVDLSTGNSRRASSHITKSQKVKKQKVLNLNMIESRNGADNLNETLGRTLNFGAPVITPKARRGMAVWRKQQDLAAGSEDFNETLVASDKVKTPFFIQGESLTQTQKLESSQPPGSGSMGHRQINMSSSRRLNNQILNSGKTFDLLIIGGQALISNSNTTNGSPQKNLLRSQPRVRTGNHENSFSGGINEVQNLNSGNKFNNSYDRRFGNKLEFIETQNTSNGQNQQKSGQKLRQKLGLSGAIQNDQAHQKIRARMPETGEAEQSRQTGDVDFERTREEYQIKQETNGEVAGSEEKVIGNIRRYIHKNTGKTLDVKSLKPKTFVFRMYAKDSALHDADELQKQGIFSKGAKYL